MAASTIKLEETAFVKDFYPYGEQTELSIAFVPLRLVKSSQLRSYCEKKKFLNTPQIDLLDYIFGDGASISDTIGHEEEMEDEDYEFEYNFFRRPGTIEMQISCSGKDAPSETFYWLRYDYKEKISLSSFVNFIYYRKGSFYGIQPSGFVSQLKSLAYNKEKRKYNEEDLQELFTSFNSDGSYDMEGQDFLSGMGFKCSKSSLSKVLISLFPSLNMQYIVELSDFINSEILSEKSDANISENIFELVGELITYFYNAKNYQYPREGTLGNSCMRFDNTTEQIRFYANNPTNVSLLAYIENKKLLARAVLWTSIDGNKFTDRIYCSSSKYGTKLAGYCKRKGYKTIHNCTAEEYGITLSHDCIVQLDSFELYKSHYPYLDSMYSVDVINKLLSPVQEKLLNYIASTDKDYLIKSINRMGGVGYCGGSDENAPFRKNKKEGLRYLKDSQGKKITSQLNQYAIIRKPKLSVVNRDDIITLNGTDRVDAIWCEEKLIKKYNSIRPTLIYNRPKVEGFTYTMCYVDKQFVVYSAYHKIYILKSDSEYVSSIKTFVIKDIIPSNNFQAFLKLSKLRKIYGGKLVKITPEYLSSLKEQIAILPFKESLMDIRKSRVYNISIKNILWNGVRIKGILIPFKHLRFVKK